MSEDNKVRKDIEAEVRRVLGNPAPVKPIVSRWIFNRICDISIADGYDKPSEKDYYILEDLFYEGERIDWIFE